MKVSPSSIPATEPGERLAAPPATIAQSVQGMPYAHPSPTRPRIAPIAVFLAALGGAGSSAGCELLADVDLDELNGQSLNCTANPIDPKNDLPSGAFMGTDSAEAAKSTCADLNNIHGYDSYEDRGCADDQVEFVCTQGDGTEQTATCGSIRSLTKAALQQGYGMFTDGSTCRARLVGSEDEDAGAGGGG